MPHGHHWTTYAEQLAGRVGRDAARARGRVMPVPGLDRIRGRGTGLARRAARQGGALAGGAPVARARAERDRAVLQRRGLPRGVPRLDPGAGLRATSRCCWSTTARRTAPRPIAERVRRARPALPARHPAERRPRRRPQHRRPARPAAATSPSSTPTTCCPPHALAALMDAAHGPGLRHRGRRGRALRQPRGAGSRPGSRRCTTQPRTGVTHRGLPAAAAQPLHLEQGLPPRLLGRAGPVVPRGRRLRGPADHHPAVRPGAARSTCSPTSSTSTAPATTRARSASRPRASKDLRDRDRGLGGEPRRAPRRAVAASCTTAWLAHALRRPLPLVPHQHGHRRRRLLGRAGRRRP